MTRFDVHGHLVPEAWLDTYRRAGPLGAPRVTTDEKGATWVESPGSPRWNAFEALRDTGARREWMTREGIQRQLLLPPTPVADYSIAAGDGRTSARLFNEAISEVASSSGGVFLASCTVPLQDPRAAIEELEHAVSVLGARAVLLGTNPAPFSSFDDDELFPFFRRVSELGVPLVLHPDERLMGDRLAGHRLSNLVGNPMDTTIAIAQLIFGGVLERLPDLRVCLVHGGGALAYLLGRWNHGARALDVGAARSPQAYLDQIWVDTLVHSDASLDLVVDTFGTDRVVLGTDAPYGMGDPELFERHARRGIRDESLLDNAETLVGVKIS